MKSNFGNYVIQKAIEISMNRGSSQLVEQFLPALQKRITEITDKKIKQKWDLIIKEAS